MIGSTTDLQLMLTETLQELSQDQLINGNSYTPANSMRSDIDIVEQKRQSELLELFSLPDFSESPFGDSDFEETDPTDRLVPSRKTIPSDESEAQDDFDDAPTLVLPMQLSNLEVVSLTDTGKQRSHNEDFFSAETSIIEAENPKGRVLKAKGLYILCDGMGGHAGGEIASGLAVESLQTFFHHNWHQQLPDTTTIQAGILAANSAVYQVNQQRASSGNGRMGTTVVVALLQDTHLAFAHVGDSRLYRLTRKSGLEQLTTDHEVGQREIQRGVKTEIAYARPDAYQLTQALGPRDSHVVQPDIAFLNIREDSLFILCSDGLTDNDLLEIYWQSHLLPLLSSKTNLEHGMHQLVELANQYNGHDNISLIAFRVKVTPDLSAIAR